MEPRMILKAVITFLLLISFGFSFIGCEKQEMTPEEEFLDDMIIIRDNDCPDFLMPLWVSDYQQEYSAPMPQDMLSDEEIERLKQTVINEFYGIEIPECRYNSTNYSSRIDSFVHIYTHVNENTGETELTISKINDLYIFNTTDTVYSIGTPEEEPNEESIEARANELAQKILKDKLELYNHTRGLYTDGSRGYWHKWTLSKGAVFVDELLIEFSKSGGIIRTGVDNSSEFYDKIPDISITEYKTALINKIDSLAKNNKNIKDVKFNFSSVNSSDLPCIVAYSKKYEEYYVSLNFGITVCYNDGAEYYYTLQAAFPFAKRESLVQAPSEQD